MVSVTSFLQGPSSADHFSPHSGAPTTLVNHSGASQTSFIVSTKNHLIFAHLDSLSRIKITRLA